MKQTLPLTILLTLSLLIGILTITDYGESWDELKLYDYAADSLEAYGTWFQQGTIPVTGDRFENYGPFFVMLTRTITKTFTQIFPTVQEVDVQHFVYFLTFLLGVWAFYHLAVRWMSHTAAFGATLLFTTQPVLWGHAFINPKDIPLLSLFLLSLYLGMRMHDSLFGYGTPAVLEPTSASWNQLLPQPRRLLLTTTIVWLAVLVTAFGSTSLVHQWIDALVREAASGEGSWLTQIVPRIQRVAPEIYVERFFVLFLRVRSLTFLLATGILVWLYRRNFPAGLRVLGIVLPAGIILGLTVSIRIFGVWAGVLVAGYILWTSGQKSWLALTIYAGIAIFAMYLTWPYLWPDPIGHFWETIRIMSQHPWPGMVLFNGTEYPASDLPASYMPLLLGIQLTEPVWFLFFVGFGVAVFGFIRKQREPRELLIFTLVWFVLPLATFVVLRPTLYDNFRQTFFILPPIFFMAGLSFDLVQKPLLQGALIALVAMPGLISSIRLHPYEYVYYNQFIGGVREAVDRFELEYWATSYREAAQETNRIAPPNANVWVDGPAHLFNRFARPDFHIYSPQEPERADHYDIVVTLARYDLEKTSFADAPIVYRVTREGAVFAVIRQP
ncbi:MAG TPA: hypothetical protein VJ830_02820 [Anaerolineales bacterium]|nr:hypothetical protein [Anaerolineales bacterium]